MKNVIKLNLNLQGYYIHKKNNKLRLRVKK